MRDRDALLAEIRGLEPDQLGAFAAGLQPEEQAIIVGYCREIWPAVATPEVATFVQGVMQAIREWISSIRPILRQFQAFHDFVDEESRRGDNDEHPHSAGSDPA